MGLLWQAHCAALRREIRHDTPQGTDLLHKLTLPRASWVGMLKSTKVHIELLTDQELSDDIEAGIRGCVCVPYQSHAVANDPRVQETTEPHSFIGYWDANSL